MPKSRSNIGQNIAVIGAGQMGTGIAQTVAQHGMTVLLSDVDLARAEAGKAAIEAALVKLVGRGKLEADAAEGVLAKVTPIGEYQPMADASLIIEAATEQEPIKQKIFESAGEVLSDGAI
ncbi:MAG: 3-hydroxyacyl-CoA dehydrogenase NAD-binding domain-containing protein, partial [Pseudomonadota bacterium]